MKRIRLIMTFAKNPSHEEKVLIRDILADTLELEYTPSLNMLSASAIVEDAKAEFMDCNIGGTDLAIGFINEELELADEDGSSTIIVDYTFEVSDLEA